MIASGEMVVGKVDNSRRTVELCAQPNAKKSHDRSLQPQIGGRGMESVKGGLIRVWHRTSYKLC